MRVEGVFIKKVDLDVEPIGNNGMLRHSLGGAVICIYLQHFIASALGLMPCLQAQSMRALNSDLNRYYSMILSRRYNKLY